MSAADVAPPNAALNFPRGDPATLVISADDTIPDTLTCWVQPWGTAPSDIGDATITPTRAVVDDAVTFAFTAEDTATLTRKHRLVLRDTATSATWASCTLTSSIDGDPDTSLALTFTGGEVGVSFRIATFVGAGGPGGGSGLPDGGTTGQIIAKASDTDQDYEFVSRNAANGYAGLDGDGTLPDILMPASIARDSEVSSAVAAGIAALPILGADIGIHVITNEVYSEAEIDPVENLPDFETYALEFWGIPTDRTSRVWAHNEITRTNTGLYDYDPVAHTFTRSADADTTAKLHDKLIITTTRRERSAGGLAENPDWRPIDSHVRAVDPTDEIGVAVWWVDELIDTETFNLITGFLSDEIAAGVKVYEPAIYPGVGRPLVMATDAVDGTGTATRLLEVALGAPATPATGGEVVDIPAGWADAGLGELPMSSFAALLGGAFGAAADPDNTNTVIIPGGPLVGVYRPTVDGGGDVVWTEVDAPAGHTFAQFDFSAAAADAFGSIWVGLLTATRFKTIVPGVADLPSDDGQVLTDDAGSLAFRDTTSTGVVADSTGLDVVTGSTVAAQMTSVDTALADLQAVRVNDVFSQLAGSAVSVNTLTSMLTSAFAMDPVQPGDVIRGRGGYTILNNSGTGSKTSTLAVYANSTQVATITAPSYASGATVRPGQFEFEIIIGSGNQLSGSLVGNYAANISVGNTTSGPLTVDLTSGWTFDVRGATADTIVTQAVTLLHVSVEHVKAN